MAELVKMKREAPTFSCGPVTADVHMNEVQHWTEGGWYVVEDTEGKTPAAKRKHTETDKE